MIAINAEEIVNRLKKVIIHSLKHIMIIALPVVIIFVILSGIAWFIFDDEGTWDENEKGNPKSATKTAKLDTTNGISMDLETTLRQGLSDMGLSEERIEELMNNKEELIDMLKMTEKLKRTITPDNLSECTEAEILWCLNSVYSKYLKNPEQLQKLLDAELITQYPKISSLSSDKKNGIIEFHRFLKNADTNGEGTEVTLTYINTDSFNEKFNEYIEKGNTEIFKYFSIDEEGNALVVAWNEENGEFESNNTVKQSDRKKIERGFDQEKIKSNYNSNYSVSTEDEEKVMASYLVRTASIEKINYKQMVQSYTLPFEYLWALVVMGESSDFVVNLANLALNDSSIIIGIYDNTTVTVNTNRKEYTENFRKKDLKYEGGSPNSLSLVTKGEDAEWKEESYSYYEQEIVTMKYDTLQVDMLYANVWIVETKSEYENLETDDPTYESDPIKIEDEEWIDDGSYLSSLTSEIRKSTSINPTTGLEEEHSHTVYIRYEHDREKKLTGRNYTSKMDTHNSKYNKVTTETREKTDIDENTSSNFVKLLRADIKAFNLLTTNSTKSWLIGIIKKNQSTANMGDLTLYLIEKAKNPDQNVTSINYDFSIFEWTGNFINSGNKIISSGDFDVSDKSLFITDVNILKQAFKGYSNCYKLIEHAQDFIDMQEKYQVNALFAAAVSITETGAGNKGNAVKEATAQNSYGVPYGQCWNNWFNIKGGTTSYGIVKNGEGVSHYKIYNNVLESVNNFGYNIAEGSYYYKNGKFTVSDIGHTYCPNSAAYPTQGDDWVKNTLNYISNFYSAAGITISSTNINNGEFTQFYQNDYANVSYGNSNLAKSGCGPTSFAMIATAISGQTITPKDAISWCGNLYYVSGIGTSWSYFQAAAKHFGLNVSIVRTTNILDVVIALKNGKYVISSQGPGLFTSGGHYIVLTGVDENNNIIVKDPNKNNALNKGYNNRIFKQQEIDTAAKQYFIFN